MGRLRAPVVFVVLTLLAPLLVGLVVVVRAAGVSPLESAAGVEPLLAPVESATRSGEAVVQIKVVHASAMAPRVQAGGLLTSVDVAAGGEVAAGDVVATVDGARLVAYQSGRPLWGDVSAGSPADLVREAQRALQGMGAYQGVVDGRFGPATRAAVVAFNTAHGYGRDNPVLSVASLVWVGPEPVRVAEWNLRPGDPVAPGDPLFTTDAGLRGIEVVEPPGIIAGAAYELELAGHVAPYTPGTRLITDPAAVAAIAGAMGTLTEGAGTLRLAEPLVVGAVPSSAIVTGPTGAVCVFTDLDGPPLEVIPLSGTLGTVDLDASLIGTQVLVNPRAVRADLTCG